MDTRKRGNVRPGRRTNRRPRNPGASAGLAETGSAPDAGLDSAAAAPAETGADSETRTPAETGADSETRTPAETGADSETRAVASAGAAETVASAGAAETDEARRMEHVTDPAPAVSSDELEALSGEAQIEATIPAPGAAPHVAAIPPKLPSTGEVLTNLLVPASAVLAPNWALSRDELVYLGSAWGELIDFYFPDEGLKALGPWAGAVLATAAVVGPRVAAKTPPRLPPKPAPEKPAGA